MVYADEELLHRCGSTRCERFAYRRFSLEEGQGDSVILINDFAPILSSKLPGEMPPSGKSLAKVLLAVRKEVYEKYEDISEKKSKALRGYKRHAFMESWYPPEWETFVTYGAGSPQPAEPLNAR